MFRNKKPDTVEPVADDDAVVGEHARVIEPQDEPLTGAEPMTRDQYVARKERYGGLSGGAVLFGWLDAVALTILLVGIISAIATATGSSLDVTQSEAQLRAGNIGVGALIALLAALVVGYFAGGYVAGRLARFSGIRQGIAVWLFGLIVTIIVAIVGTVFGEKYNVFDRVSLPSMPVRTDQVTTVAIVTGAAILLATLLAAIVGGMLGQRFHTKIDRRAL